jgi:hypothetical protein
MADIIHDLELSVRATNVLTAYGHVKTLDDFMALTEAQVMRMPKAGRATWREIERMQAHLREPNTAPAAPKWGGPAYPIPANDTHDTWPGMSLRDAAALAALQGILGRVYLPDVRMPVEPDSLAHYATLSFAVADAFIAAREAKTDG